MATIVDVARMAGVSVATVSQTFSAKRPVSPRTSAKVRAAAARAGYRPSHVAASMVTGRTGTIGVVVPDIANPFFSELVRGAEAAAMTAGYMTIVCSSELDAALEDRCVEVLSDKRVDALLYLPGTTRRHTCLADPALKRTPLIVIDEELDDLPPGATVITSDNEGGAELAARHLAGLGHRDIGVIAGPEGLPTAEMRLRGFVRALAERGVVIRDERILRAPYYTLGAGMEIGGAMLAMHPRVSAVYCANDLIALGLMTVAAAHGRTVGSDLSVAGFDDIFVSQLVTPALTTVRQPIARLGRQAAQVAVDAIEGRRDQPGRIVLPVELVIRGSTVQAPGQRAGSRSAAAAGRARIAIQGGLG
jgi:DNA-binding LacI/PurR family transcriptional regulator